MSGTVRVIVTDVIGGCKGSFLFVTSLYATYNESKAENSDSNQDNLEPRTTLARRRAEKEKVKKVKDSPTKKSSAVIKRIAECMYWNCGIFLVSIFFFYWGFLPVLQFLLRLVFAGRAHFERVWSLIHNLVCWIFNVLWIIPLFILSKLVNCFWFQDLADVAYRKSRGRPVMLPGFGIIIADIMFSVMLQIVFLIQGYLLSLIPIPGLGYWISLVHNSLLYSMYAFEYKWFNMGWGVHKRLCFMEDHWAYFLGFGLPLAFVTSLPYGYVINGGFFSGLFPLLIISANDAEINSPKVDIPLKLFSVAIYITNSVFERSVKRSTTKSSSQSGTGAHTQTHEQQSSKHVRLQQS